MLASLICFGSKQVDSYGKNTYELLGVSLTMREVSERHYRMSFRRAEIDEYYKSQWINYGGSIKTAIDSQDEFDVNQKDVTLNALAASINGRKGNRKVTLAFYKPTKGTIVHMSVPSLLNCFILPRYSGECCYLDILFIWRSNECVLGLPLSLESSIRWIDEIFLPELRTKTSLKVLLGNYTYYGVNMHCYDNVIMDQLIGNIIESAD